MPPLHHISSRIFAISNDAAFSAAALEMFRYQAKHNPVYTEYLRLLGIDSWAARTVEEIPFLPIDFFRTHRVVIGSMSVQQVFQSSGTTDASPARHYVSDVSLYRRSFLAGFRRFYGDVGEWRILALVPSPAERPASSLAFMVNGLIEAGARPGSGFFMDRFDAPAELPADDGRKGKTMLIGLSYALLDFSEAHPVKLENTVVVETGGMKGRREELVREALHDRLCRAFGLNVIHSEYGMTELLSQAWSQGGGRYRCPPWMKIFIRETDDPFAPCPSGRSGMICVADLANIHGCCFIATGDLGRCSEDGSFEVLGRFDRAGVRGCNVMAGDGI